MIILLLNHMHCWLYCLSIFLAWIHSWDLHFLTSLYSISPTSPISFPLPYLGELQSKDFPSVPWITKDYLFVRISALPVCLCEKLSSSFSFGLGTCHLFRDALVTTLSTWAHPPLSSSYLAIVFYYPSLSKTVSLPICSLYYNMSSTGADTYSLQ